MLLLALALLVQSEPEIREGFALPAQLPAWDGAAAPQPRAVRVEVVPLEWEDVRHPERVGPAHLDAMFFSRGVYFRQNSLGQQVRGSVVDWCARASFETLTLEGHSHQWVTSDLAWDVARTLSDAQADRLLAKTVSRAAERDGTGAFHAASHIVVVFMGSRFDLPADHPFRRSPRTIEWEDRTLPVVVVDSAIASGSPRAFGQFAGVGRMARALGEALGLSPHAGAYCLAASDGETDPSWEHRPVLPCAPCRIRAGWLRPAAIDPEKPGRFALRPAARWPDALLVPLAGGGHYVVENRQRIDFDASLPVGGVVVWRVEGGRAEPVPAHGLPVPGQAQRYPGCATFPSLLATAFGPESRPPSLRGTMANFAVDERGVAYFETGHAGESSIEFEGERYEVVAPAAPLGVEPVRFVAVRVDFQDAAVALAPDVLRRILFAFGPRVAVHDGKGTMMGYLTSSLADYVFESAGGSVAVLGRLEDESIRLAQRRADFVRRPLPQREAQLAEILAAQTDHADAVLVIVPGPVGGPFGAGHGGTLASGARRVPYLLVPEGAAGWDLSGPAALVARAAGLEGRSASTAQEKTWCLAGRTVVNRDRVVPGPSLPCSWCRVKLGWLAPRDVRGPGKFALAPLAVANHAVRIPVAEGEYYLLENRARWGFDAALPREGLVIWHVTPPDARCTSCVDGGVLDVWLVHETAPGGAAQRYQPFLVLPKKGLSIRLSDGRTDIAGIKTDARSNVYFEIVSR